MDPMILRWNATASPAPVDDAAPRVKVNVPPPTGTPIDAAAMTPAEFAALAPKGAVTSVSIASPPVVTFQLTDASNRGIKGLGFTSQNATAKLPGLSNLAFAMAKLVPGSNGSPSKWVSYIVTASPTTTAGEVPTRPTTDNIGTLVDNGDGTYKYTFYRDITKVKDVVAAASLAAPSVAADLGDLTYDPAKLHRLAIQVGGNARGTGTNTANGANSGVTAVPMGAPVNIMLDWYPASGKVVARHRCGPARTRLHRQLQRMPQQAGVPRRQPGRHQVLRGVPHRAAQVRLGQRGVRRPTSSRR